ncbi:RimJ/RimL family protein N-acetyltransferase [Idiomarina tyrosinivorans]|uniref:RimJ/RimL family protein N-acetyltransferase n=1 Tax=Idiomarina tyrosinivorans TaxID=1445662 RepID=A0A432ZQU2_9GAMM|nr:GNAT family N-acetyltransferase [Idiomarina tyrosinivorans]RUO80196.1 RimJ/RimL family protein N-acetyltransferase [Idiomarina tyrosinivorans]
MTLFETQRVTVRQLSLNDAEWLLALFNSQGFIRYIGDREIRTVAQAKRYIQQGPLKSYQETGLGLYAVEAQTTATPVGVVSLLKRDYLEHIDVGYAMLPEHQGQGYALAATAGLIDYARWRFALSQIDAISQADNQASIMLLQRLQFRYQETIQLPGSDDPVARFSLLLDSSNSHCSGR